MVPSYLRLGWEERDNKCHFRQNLGRNVRFGFLHVRECHISFGVIDNAYHASFAELCNTASNAML